MNLRVFPSSPRRLHHLNRSQTALPPTSLICFVRTRLQRNIIHGLSTNAQVERTVCLHQRSSLYNANQSLVYRQGGVLLLFVVTSRMCAVDRRSWARLRDAPSQAYYSVKQQTSTRAPRECCLRASFVGLSSRLSSQLLALGLDGWLLGKGSAPYRFSEPLWRLPWNLILSTLVEMGE